VATTAASRGGLPERPGWRALRGSLLGAGLIAVGALAALVIYPSGVLIAQSLSQDGRATAVHYARVAADSQTYGALANSLVIAAWTTVGATVGGVILAWLVARTDLPRRDRWHTALLVPYMIPPFIGAMAWVYLWGPAGYLNQAWMVLTAAPDPLFVIYGPAGIVLVMILYQYPIPYLTTLGVLQRMNPALEEAGRMARAGPWNVLREITIPLVLPGVLSGALLVMAASLGNFGIPAIIGFPARYVVLTTRIYSLILDFDRPGHLQLAAALSMWLVAIAVVVLQVQRAVLARGRFAVIGGQASATSIIALGRWRLPVLAGLGLLVFVSVVLPLGAILLTSVTRAYGLPPLPDNLTLRHYVSALTGIPKVQRALINSLVLAAGAASVIVVLAAGFAYLTGRTRMRALGSLEVLATVPYAIPGTVVALAMILAWLRPVPLVGLRLYDTLGILFIAYVARFLIFGVRTILAGLAQIHGSLEEAARISGAGPGEAFVQIALPLIRPSLVAGWFLAFIPAAAELTLSILLVSVGHETIGVVIFGLHEEGKIALSAALAFLVTVLLVGINLLSRTALRADSAG
jgi:iron(III) transport system permease protein